ncbi:hypothetical protein F5887DRAFT_207607 [Amanita rubescens]|nr:hypothetical protein F5887DRAFT_207607 [Amanita rubescens]
MAVNIDLSASQLITPAVLVNVHLKPGYPFIDIYAPAYPYLDIYPRTEPLDYPCTSAQYPSFELYPKSLNAPPPEKYPARSRPRYTHSQLHEQVLKERSPGHARKKSHRDLYFDVFPDGIESTELLDESYPTPDSGNLTPLLKGCASSTRLSWVNVSSQKKKNLFNLCVFSGWTSFTSTTRKPPALSYNALKIQGC